MTEKNHPDSTVGYGKPPKYTQFKPGHSGNPKGRPRKSTTVIEDIEAELRSSITVVEGGKRRIMSKRRAIVKQQANKALNGDIKSTALLFKIQRQPEFERQDNLGLLLEEFREKNRRISAKQTAECDASTDPTNFQSPKDPDSEQH